MHSMWSPYTATTTCTRRPATLRCILSRQSPLSSNCGDPEGRPFRKTSKTERMSIPRWTMRFWKWGESIQIFRLSAVASARTCAARSEADGEVCLCRGNGMTDARATTYQYDRWGVRVNAEQKN